MPGSRPTSRTPSTGSRGATPHSVGEVHDNPVDHALRGALLRAFGPRHPAVVFEQFTATTVPIAPPAAGESLTVWLDRNGFDRRGWRWPIHEPVVTAALAVARGIWGSNMSRAQLGPVVTGGASAAPKAAERRSYDLVILTPRTARPDPCEELRRSGAVR